MSPATVGEARSASSSVTRPEIWALAAVFPASVLFLCAMQALTFSAIPYLSDVPWRLPLLAAWGAYMCLASSVSAYVNLYLPRTPLAVDRALRYGCFVAVGSLLWLAQMFVWAFGSNRLTMACTAAYSVLCAALVVFWACIASRYRGGPSDPDTSASTHDYPLPEL
ncbi:hypothetical protein ACP4OV_011491 [Aristida adscensionis]